MKKTSQRIKIEYDPHLMQDVVLQEVERREKDGDSSLFKDYHKLTDPIYEEFSIGEREAEFDRVHEQFFLRLGFGEVMNEALKEFPALSGKVEAVVVGKAMTKHNERADLSQDFKSIGIKILVERFLDPHNLQKLLRHELMHVSDMLDRQFRHEYREMLNVSFPAEENIIRDRYRVLWDIYIDSRLIRAGKKTVSDKHGRYQEFEALYYKIPNASRMAIFDGLWQMEMLTHDQILEMAVDTGVLLQRLGAHPGTIETLDKEVLSKSTLLLGSLCPLCRFPTFNWVDDLDQFDKNVIELIQEDYPHWTVENGACGQCVEGYEVRVGQWQRNV